MLARYRVRLHTNIFKPHAIYAQTSHRHVPLVPQVAGVGPEQLPVVPTLQDVFGYSALEVPPTTDDESPAPDQPPGTRTTTKKPF